MQKILGRIGLALVVTAAVMYLVDWAVWGMRGRPMGTVQVSWFQVAPLKDGGERDYPNGSGPVACSQSVAPHGGGNPCWYVEQHPQVFER